MRYPGIVHIKKGEARALKAGGAWIYDNEIERTEGTFDNGDLVTVLDFDGAIAWGMDLSILTQKFVFA